MFSTRSSLLVSHFDGMFTRYSASTNRLANWTNDDLQSDLITFLSIVQNCNVDYLPITWQPALSTLGEGGSGMISQSTFSTDLPLAFKRFHEDSDSGDSGKEFLPLISEVLILSQPPIQSHLNIVNLEGICWEIKRKTQKAVPVLVFEKAAWDLQQFMNVREGMDMLIGDRLKICADIGSAIMALHAYNVVHGDIKPQNVLVFKDATTNKTTVKVTDFGYSTLTMGEAGKVLLPKSRPWNAPEHHFGEFIATEAKKTDVYSFGMLCLWVLFGDRLSDILPHNTESETESVSFDVSTQHHTLLERLKDEDQVEHFAAQLMHSVPDLNADYTIYLKEFFSLTVPLNPEKRTSDLGKLVGLLRQDRARLDSFIIAPIEATVDHQVLAGFRIAENLADFMVADYRVRIQIKDSLKKKYKSNQPSAANIAFQVAFCYHIGFGAKSDDTQRHIWLERSMRQVDDLKVEIEAVRPVSVTNERIRKLNNGSFTQVDLIHEYRTCGLNILQEAQTVYEREVTDMVQAFGSLHFIPLTLNGVIGHLLDELRKFEQSKKLRMRIRDQIATSGVSHPYYAESILNVANSHTKLGEWKEAADLQEIAIKYIEGTNRAQSWAVASIKSSLALSLSKQGRLKEAEELLIQVVKAGKRDLGQEHPDTLTSVANLASTFSNQGRWKEAEELQVQVMETEKRLLGYEHPSTMTSINNLAMTYSYQGRFKHAEELQVQAVATRKKIFGQEHPTTLTSMANLAITYGKQGRWKEAEELEVQVMETEKRVLGQEHPSTLTSMSSLALTYYTQGQWKQAEELQTLVIEMSKRILGLEHPSTLNTMTNLASTYFKQGQWCGAEELLTQVMGMMEQVLGREHPSTLTSISNLAVIYWKQGRFQHAAELDMQAVESRKRVLGRDHPSTLSSMGNLASTLSSLGRWKEAEELGVEIVETRKKVLGREHPDTLTSMGNLASTYKEQGRLKEAKEMEVQVVEMSKRVLGQESPDTLVYINNLASTYKNQGRWKEAEELFLQVTETRKRILGQEHPSTLISMSNLALTYYNQGRWKEAEELFVQVMSMMKGVLGQEHPDTLTTMAYLALTLSDQGRWTEAMELEVQVVETRKRVLGQDHPTTLVNMGNLALTYYNLGKSKEAEAMFMRVMETTKRVLGEEHPDTVTCLGNIALSLWSQGRWKKAEELEVQVVEKRMRILGHEHPHTLVAMNNLATTYKNQRRWNEAEDLQMQVVSILRTTLGDDHPSTVIATSNLALYRRVRAVLWPFLVGKELMGGLWDKLQQFVALWKS